MVTLAHRTTALSTSYTLRLDGTPAPGNSWQEETPPDLAELVLEICISIYCWTVVVRLLLGRSPYTMHTLLFGPLLAPSIVGDGCGSSYVCFELRFL